MLRRPTQMNGDTLLGGEQKVENRWDRWCSTGVLRGCKTGMSPPGNWD